MRETGMLSLQTATIQVRKWGEARLGQAWQGVITGMPLREDSTPCAHSCRAEANSL